MALLPGTKLGPYEILTAIGAGGMGEVYRARDTRLKREVAIKVLPDGFSSSADRLARFQREAEVLATLNHSNIAAVYGLETDRDTTGIVLELVEGDTLAQVIARGRMTLGDALPIARQIAEAVEAAHDKGVVHRDLKPANIKITPEGKVKVLDFGLAKIFTNESTDPTLSNSPTMMSGNSVPGMILGTAAYMSPEQARGKTVDKRTDVWAFGVVLFEMLTGRRPFEGETVTDILGAIVHKSPDWTLLPSETPSSIRRLLRRCLARDVAERLRDIGDATLDIAEATHEPMAETLQANSQAGIRIRRREMLAWISALVFFIAAGAIGYFAFANEDAQVTRLTIPVMRNSLVEDPGAVISPDGRKLAFAAADPSGKDVLWIQPLDKSKPAALAGTDGAYLPFWSPDSESVAFFAQGKLKKIAVSGGPPTTLCDAPRAWGGSWNSDGVIIFSPDLRSPIHRVSSQGGDSKPITSLDKSSLGDAHQHPSFLPDGEHFVFQSFGANAGIHIRSLNSESTTRIATPAEVNTPAIVTSDGFLLSIKDGIVGGQRLDSRSRQLTGEKFPIAEGARFDGSFGSGLGISVSANGILAYRAGTVGQKQLRWFDRAGRPADSVGPPGNYQAPALSPDQSKIAVGLEGRILLLDILRGGVVTPLTFGQTEYCPIWSPDGKNVVYGSSREGGTKLYQKSSSGTGSEQLLVDAQVPFEWTADGRYLTYLKSNPTTGDDLYMLEMTGAKKPVEYSLSQHHEYENRLSPDQKWMAYVSEESGTPEIFVGALPASQRRERISTAGGVQPIWRADGRELFYLALDGKIMAVEVKTSPDFQAGVPQPLFQARTPMMYQCSSYVPTRDGQRFLVNTYAEEDKPSVGLVLNWRALVP